MEKRGADLSMNLALTGAREKVVDYSVAYIGQSRHSHCLSLWLQRTRGGVQVFNPPDDPLTFSVSSPLPLPQVLKTSDIVSDFSNNFLQWYSIYRPYEPQAWLLLLAVMLFMGGNQKLWHWILSGFQVLSWVWSESVAEKRTNAEVSSSIILSLTPSRSISA